MVLMKETDQYKEAFLSEAKEHIAGMNKALLKLEKKPAQKGLADDIVREAHTLKSMAATMEYEKTVKLCHAIEDVLDGLRKRKIELASCVDILFESFDTLESNLKEIAKGKGEVDTGELVQRLHAITRDEKVKSSIVQATDLPADDSMAGGSDRPSSIMERISSIEVKVERLDLLMNLAEELLINKMRLDRIKEELGHPELTAAVDTLGRLISDVQFNVMQSRLVPISFIFNRFPRMVRDLAKHQGKEATLQMDGGDIELDRSVIDEIGESLVHILRNAVDHGIERPEERKKAGKSPAGTIKLSASRTKGFVVITVADDGKGLDFEEIKRIAVKRGVLPPGATGEEVMNSVFFGVSTTTSVTEVSGRGFGLNIAKGKVESLGGSIKVDSSIRRGTSFTIEIPLTLAIIKALFIKVGEKDYAIPLANIERLVTVPRENVKGMLEFEAIVQDEEDVPVTRLNALFDVPSKLTDKQQIVIVRKGDDRLGLAVDSFMSTEEIVLKPLNRLVKENRYFSGSTITGSGDVVLILDVSNLILSKRIAYSV